MKLSPIFITDLRRGAVIATGFIITAIGFSYTYAAFTSLSPVNTGDTLSKTAWNTMVSNLDDLYSRVSAISGSGGRIGIGTLNPWAKLEVVWNVKITDGTQGAGKILTSDANGVASWGSQFDTYVNTTGYSATNVTLTAGSQNIATVMTVPSAGTYLIWITSRVDFWVSSQTHFYLSSSSNCSSPLFWINFIQNANPTYTLVTTYSNFGILPVSGSTTIYACWTTGSGILHHFGINQSSAGYLKLK